MSKPKWKAWKYVDGDGIQGADGKLVALLAGRTYPHDEQFGCLIAAAPELYESLDHLAASVAEMAGRGIRLSVDVERAIDAAGAAMKKARGETP